MSTNEYVHQDDYIFPMEMTQEQKRERLRREQSRQEDISIGHQLKCSKKVWEKAVDEFKEAMKPTNYKKYKPYYQLTESEEIHIRENPVKKNTQGIMPLTEKENNLIFAKAAYKKMARFLKKAGYCVLDFDIIKCISNPSESIPYEPEYITEGLQNIKNIPFGPYIIPGMEVRLKTWDEVKDFDATLEQEKRVSLENKQLLGNMVDVLMVSNNGFWANSGNEFKNDAFYRFQHIKEIISVPENSPTLFKG